jgi:hypothetical protein
MRGGDCILRGVFIDMHVRRWREGGPKRNLRFDCRAYILEACLLLRKQALRRLPLPGLSLNRGGGIRRTTPR